jgi:hypothetical protein
MLRFLFVLLLFNHGALAVEFSSPEHATTVVELYTSEGCSSCPPADKWLSQMQQDSRLFESLLPLAFHVDYWDQLGWKDRFAQSAFSERQRGLVRQGLLSQVYTPGIVVNSAEWRAWFKGQRRVPAAENKPGILRATLANGLLQVHFKHDRILQLNVAYLGLGLKTEVASGENRNRTLEHDFVVLDLLQQQGKSDWQLSLPTVPDIGQQRTAIAVWLTEPGSLSIIQAAATYID